MTVHTVNLTEDVLFIQYIWIKQLFYSTLSNTNYTIETNEMGIYPYIMELLLTINVFHKTCFCI